LVVVVAVAITLPLHYVYGLATMGHLGSLYVAVALFIVGSIMTLRRQRLSRAPNESGTSSRNR